MTSFLGHHPLHTFLSTSNLAFSPKPKPLKYFLTCAAIPARDRVIDFGKYKGRMLGTLPSNYLKWVSRNLRTRDFEEWAVLADQVLQDPVYSDRVEWEFAEKLLNGDVLAKSELGAVAELLEISHRFGWDNEDKVGWSKVDFQLLGTSNGGRIPRVNEKKESKPMVNIKKVDAEDQDGERWGGVKERRVERRERLKMKNKGILPNMNDKFNINSVGDNKRSMSGEKVVPLPSSSDQSAEVYNPFPGRETLLRKALNRRSIN